MKRLLTIPLSLLLFCGCIKNDLPYPRQIAEVVSIEVDQAISTTVNVGQKTISIKLKEAADIEKVLVKSIKYKHDNTVSKPELLGEQNLKSARRFVLSTYQDYTWTVSATQTIERYVTVSGQIGAATIDDVNKRVILNVAKSVNLEKVTITSLKLAPADISKYYIDISDPQDFTNGLAVPVTYGSKAEIWMLYANVSETSVEMKEISPWTGCAFLSANGVEGTDCGFKWRKKGGADWQEATDVTMDGGTFKCRLDALSPLTEYECLAYCGEDETEVFEFTTEEDRQLPNAGFETFSNAESDVYKSWYDPSSSFPELRTKWWDSGNIGSTTLGANYCIALPDLTEKKEGNASAACVSRFVAVKFAAGNTFCGKFDHLVGTSGGVIHFGRPWTVRPRSVKLWYKYECGAIDCLDGYPEGKPVSIGDPDKCSMTFAIGDWDYHKYGGDPESPVEVNTTNKSTLFDPNAEAIIAIGTFYSSSSTSGWTELEIPLEYRSYDRRPTHIIVSFASSSLGDYFTGSSNSRLWIDDIRLIY